MSTNQCSLLAEFIAGSPSSVFKDIIPSGGVSCLPLKRDRGVMFTYQWYLLGIAHCRIHIEGCQVEVYHSLFPMILHRGMSHSTVEKYHYLLYFRCQFWHPYAKSNPYPVLEFGSVFIARMYHL